MTKIPANNNHPWKTLTLLQQFNFLCIVALILFAVTFGWITTQALKRNMITHAKEDSATYIREEMASFFSSDELISAAEQPGSKEFAHKMEKLSFSIHYFRAKVWNRNRQIIWADDYRLIGLSFPDNHELEEALTGEIVSEIKAPGKKEHLYEREHKRIMELYVPIQVGTFSADETLLVLEIYENLDPIFRDIQRNNRVIWGAVSVGFAFLYIVLFGIVLRASKTIEEQTKRLVRSKEKLVRADKLVSLATLSAGVAHEINNPNQIIFTHISLLETMFETIMPILKAYHKEKGNFTIIGISYEEFENQLPILLKTTQESSLRISHITDELQDYAHHKPTTLVSKVNVNKVVRSAIKAVKPEIECATKHLIQNLSESLPAIIGNFQRLEQLVINLLVNACQATSDPAKAIRITSSYDTDGEQIVFSISDEGKGISKENESRVFDPFFTTKGDGGSGLGLAIAYLIVQTHNGAITVDSIEGKGTTVKVVLPVEESLDHIYCKPH